MPDWLFFSTTTDWTGATMVCIRWTCFHPGVLFVLSPIIALVAIWIGIQVGNLWGMIRGKAN